MHLTEAARYARHALPRRSDLRTARLDLAAALSGYCNAHAWHHDPRRAPGGYTHWRCTRRRGHAGRHRGANYTWTAARQSCRFDPVDTHAQRADAEHEQTLDENPLPPRTGSVGIVSPTWWQRIRQMTTKRQMIRKHLARST